MLSLTQAVFFFAFLFPLAYQQEHDNQPPVPTPKDISDALLWGTYKPHLISAVTQKSKHPITVGFAFSDYLAQVGSEEEFKNSLRFRMKRDTKAQYSHHNGFDLAVPTSLRS